MNKLETYFYNNRGNLITKWKHYFKAYQRHLGKFENTSSVILEIGVAHGGSLQMWKDFLGPGARIVGADINPAAKAFEEDQIEIFIGDQEDPEFLASLLEAIPAPDIVIDDGGHTMRQQLTTFNALFPAISEHGVYICEDTHTSYWSSFGGGYRRPGTFIETMKDRVDDINAFHSKEDPEVFAVSDFTRSVHGMHFYDSMVVIEKTVREEPRIEHTGHHRLPRFKATRLPK